MKNKHIALVKRWLADNDSVSRAKLSENADAAWAARAAADAAYGAYTAADAADAAARAAADADADADADYWVKRYEEITNDK